MTRKVRFTVRNLFVLFALGVATFGLAACRPGVPVGAPGSAYTYDDSHAAIAIAFPEPELRAVAECIAGRESGWWPYSRNGQYRGIFQLGSNYNGLLSTLGHPWDPYVNAQAARIIFDSRGNWSAWSTARGCGA